MTEWLMYIVLGAFGGVLAGLLGVGGGLLIVPALVFMFTAQHFPEAHILHLALGTSLASIIFTSISSLRAHHQRGAVDWAVVRSISFGILTGTFFGTWISAQLSSRFLKGFFIIFLYYIAFRMLCNVKSKPHRQLPGAAGMFTTGGIIGIISSLVGIGGGSMTVPFLTWCNVAIHRAIGTSAAIGLPIALAGAAGYILNGLSAATPPYCLGFVYLPALIGVSATSIVTAPLGAKLAHSLPIDTLKKIFAILLIVMGTKMLMSML